VRFAIGESVVAVLLPSFEVVEDGSVVASEELCDAGCAPVLCGESDGEGASSDFWVCVWVVEQLLELRVFVWCQLNEYRCSHVEIIPQRHLVGWGHNIVTGQPRAFLIDSTRVLEGDVNMDGCVDDADLLAVIMSFDSSDPYADLNCDGVVDDADLLIVILNFGDC